MTLRLKYKNLSAEGMRAMWGVHSYVSGSGLEASLTELIYLRVSQINGCAHCIDMHSTELQNLGLSSEKLMLLSVWREAEALFSERERAALAWSELVTLIADNEISDSDFNAVRSVFSEKETADLTIAIGLINAYNRLAISFKSPPETVLNLEKQAQKTS
ncbi:MAG: carboxymuconolactone decarboxylase family protein [Candidatus Obscuribacterales bacterium]|nr:carboxymuconolactone decarboxylase family protein [Candidatus Obscuribacterales bacterium]